jgi:hypothetical protein
MLTRPKLERREHVRELTRRARPRRRKPTPEQRALARERVGRHKALPRARGCGDEK